MKTKIRNPWQDDSNTWIAYADFLMAMLILFVIIASAAISRLQVIEAAGHTSLYGQVVDSNSKNPLAGCTVTLNAVGTQTDREGKFSFEKIELSTRPYFDLKVTAELCIPYREAIELKEGRNFTKVFLTRAQKGGKDGVGVTVLPGDALFEISSAQIRPDALEELKKRGRDFLKDLQSDEVIVVVGHTDDQKYKTEAKSNWELSGERAAAVCRVFQEGKYGVNIPGHQLLAMGYGQFRPLESIAPNDSPATKEEKRKKNRRIEIRKLRGDDVFAFRKL